MIYFDLEKKNKLNVENRLKNFCEKNGLNQLKINHILVH